MRAEFIEDGEFLLGLQFIAETSEERLLLRAFSAQAQDHDNRMRVCGWGDVAGARGPGIQHVRLFIDARPPTSSDPTRSATTRVLDSSGPLPEQAAVVVPHLPGSATDPSAVQPIGSQGVGDAPVASSFAIDATWEIVCLRPDVPVVRRYSISGGWLYQVSVERGDACRSRDGSYQLDRLTWHPPHTAADPLCGTRRASSSIRSTGDVR